jgi:SAM-dependent methyltransferase
MDKERSIQIKEQINNIIIKLEDESSREYYENYLFKRGHLDRLIYMLDLIIPYCNINSHVIDLGSNIVFPYLVKWISNVKECEGISKTMYAHGENIIINHDFSMQIEPMKDFPFSYNRIDKDSIGIPMINCDLSKDRLPYKNKSVDIITCFETLEHLRCDPMNLLVEANRVINDDGIFVLTTPNANSMANIKRIFNYESPNFYPPFPTGQDVIEHVKEYSINEIKLLFESAGFEIIRLETFNHIDSMEFNHYEEYQIRYKDVSDSKLADIRKNDSILSDELSKLFLKFDGLENNRGDYIQVVAKKSSGIIKNRYCYPIYEREGQY